MSWRCSMVSGASSTPRRKRSPEASTRPTVSYQEVFAVAVRLTRGETIEFFDRHARAWWATSITLHLLEDGAAVLIVEGDAADIAVEVVERRRGARAEGEQASRGRPPPGATREGAFLGSEKGPFSDAWAPGRGSSA